jgi:protein-S-isoprenylcysteine O-methyltransferase Ste14
MGIIEIEKFMWLAIAIFWVVSSFSVKKSIKKQSGWQRRAYILCVAVAFTLLFGDNFNPAFLYKTILYQNNYWKMGGLLICACGLLFSLLARIQLGQNWSARISIKENHELIQTGPYRVTRNPIYTGFLLAFVGCSMSLGQVRGYLGIPVFLTCLLIKISQEEKFMREAFGGKWLAYHTRVNCLIPMIY